MQRNSHELGSALQQIDQIFQRAGQRPFVVFLDYDGTLTPIVDRPELAILSDHIRTAVEQLSRRLKVAVISGRELADVKRLVGIESIYYAGSHGFEIEGPGSWHLDSSDVAEFVPLLDAAELALKRELAAVDGALVERKRFSIAIHYRLVPPAGVPFVVEAVKKAAAANPRLRMTTGKMVYELQPGLDWHKGKAVLWLLRALGLDTNDVVPIFIGDDITDEDAFQTLEQSGVGIIVRDTPRPTSAHFALENPDEVADLLKLLMPSGSA